MVATILLLGLTVTLFATLFFFVTSFPAAPQARALTEFQASIQLAANGSYITGVTIVPIGGPTVPGSDIVYFKGTTSSGNPSFSTPFTVSSGIGGNSTWGLGQAWIFNFPTPLPQLQNITINVASPTQTLYSVTLPGQSYNLPLLVSRAWATPANPLVGTPFTVTAVFGGSNVTFGPGQPTVNVALIPGAPLSPQVMTPVTGQPDEYNWTCNPTSSCITTAAGQYTIFVNGENTEGAQATGVVSVTLTPNYSHSANFTVVVLITPSQPTPGTTVTPSAVVTYLATEVMGSPLTVEFWGNETSPAHATFGPWFGAPQTMTGPSTMTVTSTQTWTLPASPAAYTVAASATAGSPADQSASATLAISTVGVTVSPTQDPHGTSFTVTGTGFTGSGSATIKMTGVAGTLTPTSCSGGSSFTPGTIKTNPTGGFTCVFAVPATAPGGADTLTATDLTTGGIGTTTFTVTTPSLSLSPAQGPLSMAYTATGSGFTISAAYTVKVGPVGAPYAQCSGLTSAAGAFSCPFTVLATMPVGGTVLTATDTTTGLTSTPTFTRTVPTLTIPAGPTAGPIASNFEVSGTGFTPSSTTTMTFGGTALTPISCSLGTFAVTVITVTGAGAYTCLFQVPGFAGVGADTLSSTDHTGAIASTTFTGTIEAIAENPTPTTGAAPGAAISISGTGFTETVGFSTGLVTITLNGVTLAPTCTVGTGGGSGLDTNNAGAFTCSVTIPVSDAAGQYLLSVSDLTSGQTLSVSYTVT